MGRQTKWRHAALGVGLGLVLALLWWRGPLPAALTANLRGPIRAVDTEQARLDTAVPAPDNTFSIRQTFYPTHDGLSEIEFLLVRWETIEAEPGAVPHLFLRLWDDQGRLVAAETLDASQIEHNQTHLFRFAPQPDSAGRRYAWEIGGTAGNPLSVWGYGLDTAPGRLTLVGAPLLATPPPETAAVDLRFTSRYQLTFAGAGERLAELGAAVAEIWGLALLVLPLPGVLLMVILGVGGRRWDGAAWWGTAVALGAAIWPLLWFGLTLAGGRWRAAGLWGVLGAGWALALAGLAWRWRQGERQWRKGGWGTAVLLLILLVGLAARLLAARDLAFPPWVDASRHALITAVMVETGQTPADYAGFLPVERFPYHFGFHALSTTLALLGDAPLPDLLLYLGQLLNGLAPLTIYAAVWLWTRRESTALLAAFLVALPFFFPGYYLTWGRFTQLTAVLLLPILLVLTWLLLRGGRSWRRAWSLVGILAAGLFLIHIRVFIYYLPFALVVWGMGRGRNGRWLATAGGLGLLLVAPRLGQLWRGEETVQALGQGNIPGYNRFPTSYLEAGWETGFAVAAGLGALWLLIAAWRRRPWSRLPLALLVWVALLFLSLAGNVLGLPQTWLVNLNSMYIILFVPLAVFLAIIAERAWRWTTLWGIKGKVGGTAVATAVLTILFIFGIRQQVTILNPQTVLARLPDQPALAWLETHLSHDARVGVNSWLWLGGAWAGHDGGAWIVPLTGLRSTTPPVDYTFSRDLIQEVTAFNEAAAAVEDWSAPEVADWLRGEGVSHLFVGQRGGFLDPAALAQNPRLRLLYARGGAFVFAVR